MVGLTELESVTSSMSTRHSNHLSYNPTLPQEFTSLKTGAIINAKIKTVKKNFSKPWKSDHELNFEHRADYQRKHNGKKIFHQTFAPLHCLLKNFLI